MARHTDRLMAITAVWVIACASFAAAAAEPGGDLYEKSCSRCHIAYDLGDYAASQWPGIVKSMKVQAGLSEQDIATLTEYLVGASEEKEAPSAGPLLGGYLYTEYFRTPEEWSTVASAGTTRALSRRTSTTGSTRT